MKKYAVAIASLFENTNKVIIVEAEDEFKACRKALIEDESTEEDANAFLDDCKTVEDVLESCFNGDLLMSKPVEI